MTLKVGPRPVFQRDYVNDFSEETTEQNELKLYKYTSHQWGHQSLHLTFGSDFKYGRYGGHIENTTLFNFSFVYEAIWAENWVMDS